MEIIEFSKINYLLFDGRYYDNPDRAIIYCSESTQREAIESKVEEFPDAVIVHCKDNIVRGIDLQAMAIAERKLGN